MSAPEIQTPPEFQFYVQQRGIHKTQREFERDSLPGLQKSLSKAHDNLQKQVGINTRLYKQLATLQESLKWERRKRWITTIGLMAAAEVIKVLLPLALHAK